MGSSATWPQFRQIFPYRLGVKSNQCQKVISSVINIKKYFVCVSVCSKFWLLKWPKKRNYPNLCQGPCLPPKNVQRAKRPAVQDKGQLDGKQPKSSATKSQATAKTRGGVAAGRRRSPAQLETVYDVVQAFVTLSCIWHKLNPYWPVANIGLKICFAMKLFTHCEGEARKVMIKWARKVMIKWARKVMIKRANCYLQAMASRAASKDRPMTYKWA